MAHRLLVIPGAGFQIAQVKHGRSVGGVQPDGLRQGGQRLLVEPGAVLRHPHHEPCGGGAGIQVGSLLKIFYGLFRLVALEQNGSQVHQGGDVVGLQIQKGTVELFGRHVALLGKGFRGSLAQGLYLELFAHGGFYASVCLVRNGGGS